MKKVIIIITCSLGLLLTGCSLYPTVTPYTYTPVITTKPTPIPTPEVTPEMFNGLDASLVIPIETIVATPTPTTKQEVPGLILKNAVVTATNVNPGNSGTFKASFENTSGETVVLKATYKEPDKLRDGYSYTDLSSYVKINPNTITIDPYSTSNTIVTISIPSTAWMSGGNKLEFWINYFYDTGGFLKYSINQRYLLSRS